MKQRWLDEICAACGLTAGAHAASDEAWCPAHEGRMDFMHTTRFRGSGEYDSPKMRTRAKNAPCQCETFLRNGACHAPKEQTP